MNKTLLVRLCAGFVGTLGVWVAYTQTPQAPPQLKLEKITDDLYNISGDGGNVAAYLTSEGVILIDDKFERDNADILEKLKSITDKPVKYVLNTHQHGDHTGGNEKMRATAEIIAHRNARLNMVESKMPGVPRISFNDETEVYLGGKEVRARHFGRGHTNGDAAIYFPALKVIHTGDLCTIGGSPFIDYSAGGSAVEWTKTLDEIMKWDFDTVIPGHGPVSKRADLVKYRQNFEAMRNKVSGMVGEGKSKEDVAKMLVADFGWQANPNGLSMRSLDGLMAELKR